MKCINQSAHICLNPAKTTGVKQLHDFTSHLKVSLTFNSLSHNDSCTNTHMHCRIWLTHCVTQSRCLVFTLSTHKGLGQPAPLDKNMNKPHWTVSNFTILACKSSRLAYGNLSKAFFSGTAFHTENMSWAQTLLQNKEGRDVKIWHEEKKKKKKTA